MALHQHDILQLMMKYMKKCHSAVEIFCSGGEIFLESLSVHRYSLIEDGYERISIMGRRSWKATRPYRIWRYKALLVVPIEHIGLSACQFWICHLASILGNLRLQALRAPICRQSRIDYSNVFLDYSYIIVYNIRIDWKWNVCYWKIWRVLWLVRAYVISM